MYTVGDGIHPPEAVRPHRPVLVVGAVAYLDLFSLGLFGRSSEVGETMTKLKPCPCGKTPERLIIQPGPDCKYAFTAGGCCGEWFVEFRTHYKRIDSDACMRRAVREWNEARR